jgi:hypothetical protein
MDRLEWKRLRVLTVEKAAGAQSGEYSDAPVRLLHHHPRKNEFDRSIEYK